jgi:hypothetical protein
MYRGAALYATETIMQAQYYDKKKRISYRKINRMHDDTINSRYNAIDSKSLENENV